MNNIKDSFKFFIIFLFFSNSIASEHPSRILFVGNSYLYYNDSVHNHVKRLLVEHYKDDGIVTKSSTIGGSRLHNHNIEHLLNPENLQLDKQLDLLIMQGGSLEVTTPELRAKFSETAVKFSNKAHKLGIKTALYMTHAYVKPHKAYFPDMINEIEDAYLKVGNDNKVLVIPVGLAFERAYQQKTGIKLHKDFDGSHPSFLGTYLASCVVFASIFKTSPVGLHYSYFDAISDKEKAFLQRVAEETVAEFYGYD